MRRCCCDRREGFGPLGNWWFWSIIFSLSPLGPIGWAMLVVAIVWSLGRLVKWIVRSLVDALTPAPVYVPVPVNTQVESEWEREHQARSEGRYFPAEWML